MPIGAAGRSAGSPALWLDLGLEQLRALRLPHDTVVVEWREDKRAVAEPDLVRRDLARGPLVLAVVERDHLAARPAVARVGLDRLADLESVALAPELLLKRDHLFIVQEALLQLLPNQLLIHAHTDEHDLLLGLPLLQRLHRPRRPVGQPLEREVAARVRPEYLLRWVAVEPRPALRS